MMLGVHFEQDFLFYISVMLEADFSHWAKSCCLATIVAMKPSFPQHTRLITVCVVSNIQQFTERNCRQ